MRALTFLLLSAFAASLQAAVPSRIEATFDVQTRGIKIAEIREVFTSSGDRYRIESHTRPVGLLALFKPDTIQAVSTGTISSRGLRPASFTYMRTHDTDKNAEAHFDWDHASLLLTNRTGQRLEPLPPGLQDRLSVLYQFRHIPSLGSRKEVTMLLTSGYKVNERRYLIRPQQTVQVPLGSMETLYLSTPPEKTPWKTEIWLSVENGNFPCKIVVTEDNGEVLTQVLTGLSITQ